MLKVVKQVALLSALGLGLSVSTQAWSAPTLTGNLQQDMEITRSQILDPNLHAKLKENLSEEDYQNWSANLKEMGNPINLGNGSIYYEAFKDENLDTASGIVLNDNGLFYLMYKHPTTNKLVYISNDITCNNNSHFMTLPFAKGQNTQGIDKKQSKTMQTIQHNCEMVYANVRIGGSSRPLTKAESDALKQTALSIWDKDKVNGWTMNAELGNVIAKAVTQINECSKNIGYVPKFPGYVAKPARDYIIKNAKNIVANHLELTKKQGRYKMCITTAASKYVRAAELTQF